jgi:glycerophosphoryl diester phosphodiesterase
MTAWPYPFWIAHRGAGKLAPENTLAAFRLGAAHGYRAFECDVKLSADGQPFLLHDATLERTTNGHGTAGELPCAQLAVLDAGAWHSRQFAGEPLPTLESIAAYVQRNGFALNIEIKPTPGSEAMTGEVVARRAAAHLPRALLLDTLWEGCFDVAAQLGCVGIVTNHLVMDANTLARIHSLGMKGLVYTVNDAERAEQLQAIGIDGIITDAVDRFAPASG